MVMWTEYGTLDHRRRTSLKMLGSLWMPLLWTGPASAEPMSSALVDWTRALHNDDLATLLRLVQTGPPDLVVSATTTGKTALMIACKLGNLQAVKTLIKRGARLEARTATGGTPLMFAVVGGHLPIARYLLENHAVDIDAQGVNGWSAVTLAAAKGYAEILEFLVSVGADINAQDVYRWSPLMRAVANRHAAAVAVLLAAPGIALDLQDEAGNTALHHAVANADQDLTTALRRSGADLNVVNAAQMTALQLAVALPSAAGVVRVLSTD